MIVLLCAACGSDGGSSVDDPGGDPVGGGRNPGPDVGRGPGGDGGPPDGAAPVDPSVTVTTCATGGEFRSIQAAIDGAPAGAHIEICAGVYQERLVITKPLTLAATDGEVVVDGDLAGTALVVRGLDAGSVGLEAITIRNGKPSGVRCEGGGALILRDVAIENSRAQQGGGLYVNGCDVDILGGRVTGNTSFDKGGGVYLAGDGVVEGLLVEGNFSHNKAGGFFVEGHAPTLRYLTVRGNRANEDGGGLFLHLSSATVERSRFEDNDSIHDDGGGMRLLVSTARITGSMFLRNHAAGDGGGLKVSHADSEFVDNVFEDNVSDSAGGAMEMDDTQSLIADSTFRRNRAERGGAIHGAFIGTGAVWRDSLLEDNEANRQGGAIYIENNEGGVSMKRLTIRGNRATRSGGIGASSTDLDVRNSLVVGNRAEKSGGGIDLGGGVVASLEFNLLRGNRAPAGSELRIDASAVVTVSGSILDGSGDSVVAAEAGWPGPRAWRYNDVLPRGAFAGMRDPTGRNGNLAVEPRFMDAAAGDFRLAPGSPLIDAGDPAQLDRDGSRCDIGVHGGGDAP